MADWNKQSILSGIGDGPSTTVYHLAAYGVRPGDRDQDELVAVNTVLPGTLVRVAAELAAGLVMVGSVAEYAAPESGAPLTEESPLETTRLYGASKAAGGLLAMALAETLNVRLRYLRLFNVYGPGEASHRLLPSLLSKLLRGERVALSRGDQVRDFVYVADVVSALTAAGSQVAGKDGLTAQIWNVATGLGTSVAGFAREVARATGAPDELLAFGELPLRPDDVAWQVGSCDKICLESGWRAQYTLADGVSEAIAHLDGAAIGDGDAKR